MNKTLRALISIMGILIAASALADMMMHFWDNLKSLLPCGCCNKDTESENEA